MKLNVVTGHKQFPAKPQERAPLRRQPQTSPAPVTTTHDLMIAITLHRNNAFSRELNFKK